jgi:hypothetical protein
VAVFVNVFCFLHTHADTTPIKKIARGPARTRIHPSVWRNSLIIPKEPYFGVRRGAARSPLAPFRRLACRQTRVPSGAKTIYQTVSGRVILRSSYSGICIHVPLGLVVGSFRHLDVK